MYVSDNCSHCNKTKALFNDLGIDKYIVVNNAKDHLDYLKSENIKYIPFLKSDSGKHEGAIKDIDDLIVKLNILVKSDNQDTTQGDAQDTTQGDAQDTTQGDVQDTTQGARQIPHKMPHKMPHKVPGKMQHKAYMKILFKVIVMMVQKRDMA